MKNKIPILMPTYNRPHYLKTVLESLKKCDSLEYFKIITSEEPSQPEVSLLFDNVDFIEIERYKNEQRLGCNKNISSAISRIFEKHEELVVLEDDIVPGRDFLNYFLWGFNNKELWETVSILTAYNRANSLDENIQTTKTRSWFSCWGWGTKKSVWDVFYKSQKRELEENTGVAWDTQFNSYVLKENLLELYPLIGRSQNIGEVGTYVPSPEWQRENQFCKYWIDNINCDPVKEFKIKKPMEHYYESLTGWFDFQEIYSEQVKKAKDGSKFVEVGSFLGKSTSYMGVEIINSEKKIYFDVVDLFGTEIDDVLKTGIEDNKKNEKETFYEIFLRNVFPVHSMIKNVHTTYSYKAASLYEDNSLDFVFIDASHDYENVKKDIEAWLPKIKLGGTIGGHDYHITWPGVIQAVKETIGEEKIKVIGNSWIFNK